MEEEVEELVAFIGQFAHRSMLLEAYWIGRSVRLKKPFGEFPSPPGGQVLLPAGARGWIVKLDMAPHTPFIVEFPGFPYRVAPLLEKLELPD